MKKALILLLAISMIGVAAFAEPGKVDFSVTGGASVTWGLNLNTVGGNLDSGFVNGIDAGITITFVDEATKEKGTDADGAVYGYIKLEKFKATAWTLTAPTITATIKAKPFWIGLNNPSAAANNAAIITGSAAADVDASGAAGQGFSFGMDGDFAFSAFLETTDDWTTATSAYTTGLDATISFAPAKLLIGARYNFFTGAAGLTAKASLAMADVVNGLDASIGFDALATSAFPFDARLDASLKFSKADADGNNSKGWLAFYFGSAGAIDAEIGVVELDGDNGALPIVGGGVTADLLGLNLATPVINVTAFANATIGNIKFGASYGFKSAAADTLEAYVTVTNFVPNTSLDLRYASTDLGGTDAGIIKAKVSIAF